MNIKMRFPSVSSTVLKECYVTFVIVHSVMLRGTAGGFSAFLIPQLTREGVQLSVHSVSWLGSVGSIVGALGSLCYSFLFPLFGRVRNLQISFIIYIIGYLTLTFAPNIQFIYAGLGINSVAAVCSSPVLATYTSETCDRKRRGVFMALDFIVLSLGSSLDYLLEWILPWRVLAMIWTATAVIALLQSFLIPETPYWYVREGKPDLAKKSIQWFQPKLSSDEIESQINAMKNSLEFNSKTNSAPRYNFLVSLRKRKYFMPVFLGLILCLLRTGAGKNVVTHYTVNFFEALNTPYDSESLAAYYGTIDFIGSIICLWFIYKFNRKNCFYIFSSTAFVSLSVTIVYQFYRSAYGNPLPYLPVAGIYLYGVIITSGYYAVLFVMSTEMQFAQFRGQVICMYTFIVFSMAFVYGKLFPYIEEILQIQYTLLYFNLHIIISIFVVFFFVSDTTDKLFYETGDLKNNKRKHSTTQI